MTKEIAKEAFEAAEKSLKDKRVEEVKKIVLKTLEKLEGKKQEKEKVEEEIKILKMDIDDLKEGRLDRIAERQEKDEKAKSISVVVIIKEKEVIREHYNPWYYPYRVFWNDYVVYTPATITTTSPNWQLCSSTGGSGAIGNAIGCSNVTDAYSATIDGSTAKYATIGTYTIGTHTVHLR